MSQPGSMCLYIAYLGLFLGQSYNVVNNTAVVTLRRGLIS